MKREKREILGTSGFLTVFVIFLLILLVGCQQIDDFSDGSQEGGTPVLTIDSPEVRAAMSVQERHTDTLLGIQDVVGVAIGSSAEKKPVLLVFAKIDVSRSVPQVIEDVPVIVRITDGFTALDETDSVLLEIAEESEANQGIAALPAIESLAPTDRFARPVPIGVSTGHRRSCSAGTIGARLIDESGKVFALSNNHVFALENDAPLKTLVMQPGLIDTDCSSTFTNGIGLLVDFEPISFFTGTNQIDAAVARTMTFLTDNATPADGYGLPKSQTLLPVLGQSVQKYGRTTALTRGTITGINATLVVGYTKGLATFVNQIIVEDDSAFILPGDSGSLLVTDPGRNPVGLCFAGNPSGLMGIANPIGPVLDRFQMTIDGE
jgi:hypothetical protein